MTGSVIQQLPMFFWVKDNKIFTPPLNEGCVAGLIRKKILELATRNSDHPMQEAVLTQEILLQADEVFLTNAITIIRWVKEFRGKVYKNTISSKIFTELD
jgi:branched-chain amino acid aminotransferase